MTTQELIWNEVNCTTGETITRPFTPEEVATWEEAQVAAATRKAEQEAEAATLFALKESAKAKLVAGTPLTEEEAATIVL